MPVIEVNLGDFFSLLGDEIALEEIEKRLPLMGISWEGRTEEGFSIEVFPNRPDLLSIEGLARAYLSFTGMKTGLRQYTAKDSNYTSLIAKKVKAVRPYFASAVIKNIEFNDALIRSIIQMQEKLHVTHCRKRRKVSIGLHDLEPIKFPVKFTALPWDFSFRPLGEAREMTLKEILNELPKGREYAWILEGKLEYPILFDAKEMVLSMPPIINSEHTRIDEVTESIFVDVTATDAKAMNEVLNIITTTFADRGAEIHKVENRYVDRVVETPDLAPLKMELDKDYVNRLLGINLTDGEVVSYLERMGHSAILESPLEVFVPCYRTDIMHPIDLVEEVAIAYGYDMFVPEIPKIASSAGEDPLEVFCRKLRNFLVGFGLIETMTFMMTNKRSLFEKMCIPEVPVAETENPKTEEYNILRNWLFPGLIEVLSINKHHPYPQNLFQVDDVILLDEQEETGAKTAKHLSIALCHTNANFSEAKGVMNSILNNLSITGVEVEAVGLSSFIEGRKLTANVEGQLICWAGEVKPEVLENWSIEMPIAGLEMDVDALFKLVLKKG